MSELSILELDAEQAELLPERETLLFNHATVIQSATAVAVSHGLFAPALAVAGNVAIVIN